MYKRQGDAEVLQVYGPGPRFPALRMDGRAVFRFALEVLESSIRQLLAAEGCGINDLDWVVCHQANARIIDHVSDRLKAREGLFYKNMERFGNTSAASIPIALDELAEAGRLRPGMRVLCAGFGGGLVWSGALFQW